MTTLRWGSFVVIVLLCLAGSARVTADPETAGAALDSAPTLSFSNRLAQHDLGGAYQDALDNLLQTNTVADVNHTHNAAKRMTGDPALFVRAGGGYNEPWTRDSSLNSWNAASLLEPAVARNTLWAVCAAQPDGTVTIQQDNQWWDKVIWITAAWSHYTVTGDQEFLTSADDVARDELSRMRAEHFNSQYGLYQGPAFFCDGIAGYPEPEYDPTNQSSFVLDHPYTHELMVLSTNCVYYNAFRCAARMARALGRPEEEAVQYDQTADALRASINKNLWIPAKSTYGFFIHGAGPLKGQLDPSQEGIGLSFAILFGVADQKQAGAILNNAYRSPHGITASWPNFPRFDNDHPGRHNGIVWPLVNGMWATAAAKAGDVDLYRDETENLALLDEESGRHFYEIYNATTGVPDGGWQNGGHWGSQPDQTWSATAYLRMIYSGLFGMIFDPQELKFTPVLPSEWGSVQLTGLHYRQSILNIRLEGNGSHVAHVQLDGKEVDQASIPSNAVGTHDLIISMKP